MPGKLPLRQPTLGKQCQGGLKSPPTKGCGFLLSAQAHYTCTRKGNNSKFKPVQLGGKKIVVSGRGS